MSNEIIDPVTGKPLKSKIVEILPHPMNHVALSKVPNTREEIVESPRIGPDGVIQLFPDMAGGSEWYMPSGLGIDTQTDGKYYNVIKNNEVVTYNNKQSGKRFEFDIYAHGEGFGFNKTKFSWRDNPKPAHLGSEKGLRNHELTAYIKVGNPVGDYQSCLFRLQGRDETAIRSYLEMGYPTNSYPDVVVNCAFSISPIVPILSVQQYFSGDRLTTPAKWIAIKIVYVVADDNSNVWMGMYVDLNPIDDYGNPRNDFRLKAECIFSGVKEYRYVVPSWRAFKDSIVVEGYDTVELKYVSDREIDITGFKPLHNAIINFQSFRIATPMNYNIEDYNTVEEVEGAALWLERS